MTNYKVAEGSNVALVSMTDVAPMCRSEGLEYSRSSFAASGAIVREGAHIRLLFDVLESDTEFNSLLALFGLDSATSAAVTVYIPGPLRTFARYNGTAIRPATNDGMRHSEYFLRDVTILIRDLAVAS